MTVPFAVGVDRLDARDRRRLEAALSGAVPSVAPCVCVAVRIGGQLAYEASFGRPDPDRPEVPPRLDAIFDLASVSKLFTTSAFLALASEGRVGLDDPVASVVPELATPGRRPVGEAQEPLTRRLLPVPPERDGWTVDPSDVTFRHLLTHTAGLAPWRAVFEAAGPVPPPPGTPDPVGAAVRRRRGLEAVCGYPFVDLPSRAIHYSDLGFMLLGEAVCRLRGDTLDAIVTDRIAAPLGLGSVGYTPLGRGIPRERLVPTSMDGLWRGRRCHGEVEDENAAGLGGVAGHAGLFATASDVSAFGQAWLERDVRLAIAEPLLDEALREQAGVEGERRGLGWQLAPVERPVTDASEGGFLSVLGTGAFGHTGFTGTSLAVDPRRGLVVALLTNRVHAGRTHPGIDALRTSLHALLATVSPRA